jgi:DNA-dependent RNA polymerase auxiliary subunit epsilon
MKSKKLTIQELFDAIINKQLEPFNLTITDVKDIKDWYNKYEVTQEQSDEWIKWSIDFIKKNSQTHLKYRAEKEMLWINLMYGLKIK